MSDERAYRVVVRFEKDREQFTAAVPELEVSGSGATRAEALAKVEEAIDGRFQSGGIPPPADVLAAPESLALRLSAGTYRDLAFYAAQDGLTVEALAQELIARGLGFREGARTARRDHDRDRDRGRPPPARPQVDADAQPAIDPSQQRDRPPPRRDDRPHGRREGYRPDLDNQANFLEYARSLERGGGQGGGGGGGAGGGGRGRGRGGR